MAKKPTEPEEQIACEVCLKEIPRSVATSHEAKEYVHHFCGIDCYARWQQGGKKEKSETPNATD